MRIYEQTYESWSGRTEPRWRRVAVVARMGWRLAFDGALPRTLILACAVTAVVYLGVMFIAATSRIPPPFALGNRIYRQMLGEFFPQGLLVLTVAAVIGAPLISRDLKHQATILYVSRAIGPADYLIGKAVVLLGFLLSATLLPALLLWTGQIMLGVDRLAWGERLVDLGSITGHSLAISLPTTAAVLALSSLSKAAVVPGILWMFFSIGSGIVSEMLHALVRAEWTRLVSWHRLVTRVGELCYQARPIRSPLIPGAAGGVEPVMSYGVWPPLLILAAVSAAGVAVLFWRLRSFESAE
ncbi:MAG: hypothetical protein HY716_11410 [Planctomycetes bacterium]|nr:hypothetical protein [Planctomycetota bacterium]